MNNLINIADLKSINKPARYVGGEVNQIIKSSFKCSIVLCYPNVYEKAMSNYMVRLLYTNLNEINDIYCTRCFAPEMDFEKLLLYKNSELYSLENGISIKDSDILLFVINNELDYTNFLNMLRKANIKFDKDKREKKTPKIIVVSLDDINAKPIENFVDKIIECDSKEKCIQELLGYIEENTSIQLSENEKNKKINFPINWIVPSIKIDNSSIIVDLSMVGNMDNVVSSIKECIKHQGINRVSFINQDKIENIKFCEFVYKIKTGIDDVKISGKKIDFARFNVKELNIILPCIEKSSLEFNVMTCKNSLVSKINMGILKEELIEKIKYVFRNNWHSIRLVFNIGLPNETYEDIDDIFNTINEIVNIYVQSRAKDKLSFIVKIDCYIPKNKDDINISNINKLETKIRYIKEKECDPVIRLKLEELDMYTVKSLLKKGNEDIASVLTAAYELGSRFDLDGTYYSTNAWDKAIYDNYSLINKYIKS